MRRQLRSLVSWIRGKPSLRRTHEVYINHPLTHGYVRRPIVFPPCTMTRQDVEVASRVLEAYRRATRDAPGDWRPKGLWGRLASAFHGEWLAALDAGDPRRVAHLLVSALRSPVTSGIGGPVDIEFAAEADRRAAAYLATICADRLVSLAEALGTLPIENPEQPGVRDNLYAELERLIVPLEERLGVRLSASSVAGPIGIDVAGRLLGFRTCDHAYAAWLVRTLLPSPEAARVCEIGGGFGGAACFASKLGIGSYTIYDLPHVNAIQSYYLIRSLPDARITLYGEPPQPSGVNVAPFFAHREASPRFDLTLNQDSFPELPRATVVEYLRDIRRLSSWFLSLNQECQAPTGVDDERQLWLIPLIDEVGGFRRVRRVPYWLRHGYVEELYEATPG